MLPTPRAWSDWLESNVSEGSPVATWKPIPGWEGFYEASDFGEVRSVERMIPYRGGFERWHRGCVLKHKFLRTGHHVVDLQKCGFIRTVGVHRLVLMTFVPSPDCRLLACHDNGNPDDNRLSNLYWGTISQNAHDKRRHGTNFQVNKGSCNLGHLYAGPNLIDAMTNRDCFGNPAPLRTCRACVRTHKAFAVLKRKGLPLPDFAEVADRKYAKIMARYDSVAGAQSPPTLSDLTVAGAAMRVIRHGDTVNPREVQQRLAARGVHASTNAINMALYREAKAHRLINVTRGVYRRSSG